MWGQLSRVYLCARHEDGGIEYVPNKVGHAREIGGRTSGEDPRREWGVIVWVKW